MNDATFNGVLGSRKPMQMLFKWSDVKFTLQGHSNINTKYSGTILINIIRRHMPMCAFKCTIYKTGLLIITITICMVWLALYDYSNKFYWLLPLLLTLPPSYLQRGVYLPPALLHLHLPLHALRQPQCKKLAHATEASLRLNYSDCHVIVPSLCHLYSLKSEIFCWAEVVWRQ